MVFIYTFRYGNSYLHVNDIKASDAIQALPTHELFFRCSDLKVFAGCQHYDPVRVFSVLTGCC